MKIMLASHVTLAAPDARGQLVVLAHVDERTIALTVNVN